jgi:2-polyprenyl-3-methyl-5-hydroxy-6-metoxy-1,4-benzoquinol methylase
LGATTEAIEQALIFELAGPLAGRRVLDVGCGDGLYAVGAALQGAQVAGIDISPEMIAAATTRAREESARVDFQIGNAAALPFPSGSFDVVLAVTVLCLLPSGQDVSREIFRVLKPGGTLVVGELGRLSSWAAWRRLRGWLGSATWAGARFWTEGDLRRLIDGAGLVVSQVRGAVFYPPLGWAARFMAPVDPWLGRRTTLGAAFIAVAACKSSERFEPVIEGGGTP